MGALTQTGVPAEATAENAVVARDKALASAQRIAYERMADSLGLPKSIDSSQLDQLVNSVVIEQERTNRTTYSGRVTVNFNADRVRAFSGGAVGGPTGSAPGGFASGTPSSIPAAAYLDVGAVYATPREWVELRRRLLTNQAVANIDIKAIAVDGARLRLGLRTAPAQAAQELARAGILLGPPQPGMPALPGQGWRVSLAGGA
ncbi:hypothetical protein IAI18_02285 [Acetobacteraceae bacterium H6797]|nr:hypothetical protein [Acetobacteraceae bacterium H6797]